jgi:hypothetical protein
MLDGQEGKDSRLSANDRVRGILENGAVFKPMREGCMPAPLLADIVPALFHRSCGKACGKGALESYKFLKILYF